MKMVCLKQNGLFLDSINKLTSNSIGIQDIERIGDAKILWMRIYMRTRSIFK